MKFCVPLLLLLLFDTLQGSTLPHVRKVRALNTTLQTNFNGTYERRNPCTNAEIESTSYIASHEFHHHTHEDNWNDYTNKCSAIISGFLQAIGNLVRFNNHQNGLFNFHINTSISQKQVGDHEPGACCEPTILIEATDCEVAPTHKDQEKAVVEGKYDGPVCLLNRRNKPAPVAVPKIACNEQNADKTNPPIIISNSEIPQNEYHDTEESLEELWNPIKTSFGENTEPSKVEYSQTVRNGVAERTCEQTSPEFKAPAAPLPEPEPQVIPDTISYESSQPNFGLENSQGFQATAFENGNEQTNFNPPAPFPNSPQTSFNGIGIPPQSVVSVTNEELTVRNPFPPALPNQQGLPAVYPQQSGNENLDGQVSGPLPLPDSYPNQMPVVLPPSQTEGNTQGAPGYSQDSPAFEPTYNGQTSNLEFSGSYPPTPQQAPSLSSPSELPPPESNSNPSEVGFTETPAPGQIFDMAQTPENNVAPDQQQPITREKAETVYYNDESMNYNQVPTTSLPEIQPELLPPESQQNLPSYPAEIARNEQSPMNSVEVLPPEPLGPKEAVFSDSLVIPNGGNSDVPNSFQPVTQPNSQSPIAPAFTAPQEKPFEQPSTTPPPVESTNNLVQFQQFGIPVYQIPPNTNQTPNGPPVNSFSNQLAQNNFVQSVPTFPSAVSDISPSNNFPEQSRNNFGTLQQPDSTTLIPSAQPIPTLGPQPSQDFTGQLPENNNFDAVTQNFQNIAPLDGVPLQSSTVATPPSDMQQTAVEESQFDYPTENPEPSVSELVPNNVGNQLSEITTYDKPVLNSNNFQPETQSYFAGPSNRNPDYTPQTPFYDSVPATYKSELESQSALISNVQNSPGRPIAPESFPNTPLTPEPPQSTPDVTNTQSYSEQTRSEFVPTSTNLQFVNPPRNDFQTVAPRPGPQFMPPEQTLDYGKDTISVQQSNLTPEISNPLTQPPMENNPVVPVQQQPQFFSNQNGDFQQPLPQNPPTSPTSVQTVIQQGYQTTGPETNKFTNAVPQDQPIAPEYPQPPVQSGVPNYEIQPDNQPPNVSAYSQGKVFSQNEFYPESPQNENQQLQAVPQPVLPDQPPNVQIQSSESQEQFVDAQTTSAEFTPNADANIPPAAPEGSDSFPQEYPSVEQQSARFDGSQTSQQNYPNPGFQNRQPLPVDLPVTQVTPSQPFSGQSDSNLNYDGVQPNGILQPQPWMPLQFSLRRNPNLQPVTRFPQTGPMNTQNGVNPNELQTFAPPASFQQTDFAPSPLPPLQTLPENSQLNNFPQGSAFVSTVSPATEISAEGVDNLMLNPEQPSGVTQSERQDLNAQDLFPPAVPPQFATQSSGEATTVKPNPYQTQPSEAYFDGVSGVQTADQVLISNDEYQSPVATVQEPLNYFQGQDDVAQTTPPPLQADQFLTSQSQSEYVQNNAAMYSPDLPPRPQPQPSSDNLTEFPGAKMAGSATETPSPSEIKPETLGSQPPRQTALTQTNVPDIDNTKTPDTQPNSGSSEYLGPQIYPNFDAPAPAVNYPRQDTPSFPPTADSITPDMAYQTTNPAFTPSAPTAPTFGINPTQMVFNSNSSYFSTPMTPSERLETQPFRQASALIASPQPQPTTVKFNQQITIPQNQMPTASNPQPQATLKYFDQQSADNTEGGFLDSVVWTSSAPQEPTATTPPGPQFPPSDMGGNDENKDFVPDRTELAPVTQSSLPPTPSFEQQGSNFQEKATIVEETIATAMPKEWAYSSAEDKLAYADKLLNNGSQIQQYDQTTGQNPQTQQIYISPTQTGEVVTEYFVTPSPSFQQPMEIQNQDQIQSSSLTNSGEIETGSLVSTPNPFEQEIEVQPQPQPQSFTSTNTREVTTDSFVNPPPLFQPQIGNQPQPQVRYFPSTNMREIRDDSPVVPQLPLGQQIDLQSQTQSQPFSSTISKETVTDSFVSPPPTFQPHDEDQAQPQLLQLNTTNVGEDETMPPVAAPLPFQQQIGIQSQPQLQPFSSTNIATAPVTQISPYQQQITAQPQTEFQYPTTIMREEITDSPVTTSPPPVFQQQIDVQPQPQFQSFPSSNMGEIRTDFPVTPLSTFSQQIQPQTQPQPFSSTISRDTVTDSLVSQPPTFQPQIEDRSQPQIGQYDSTNIKEDSIVLPVIAPPAFEQQIDVQPQTEIQPFSSTITRETVTDSFVSQPPPFQPQTEDQPKLQLQSSDSTNTRDGIADSPVTASPFYQQQTDDVPQTQLQYFPSTTSGEVVPDSLVSPPPPLQQEIESQFQPQAEEFVSTNFRTETAASSLTPTSLQPQIQVQHQKQFQIISSTNSRKGITDSPVTSSTHFPGQTDDLQQQTQLTPLSSTISREIVTNSLVRPPPPPFQQQTFVEPPSQLQSFPSTNMEEIITDSAVTPPHPFPQQTNAQPQTEPQSFSSTISRETVTDSFWSQPPMFQPQTEDRPKPQLEDLNSTNIGEDKATPFVTATPSFQQQVQIQPFSSAISRETVTDSFVSQPPPFNPQIGDQREPRVQTFPSTNMKDVRDDSPITPPTPFRQQTDVQSQAQPQPSSLTISRETVTDSFVNPAFPFQSRIEDQPKPQPEAFYTTNTGADDTVPLMTGTPSLQQEIEIQSETQPQSFSSTISRESLTDSSVSQPPSLQSQIEVQSQIQPEEFYTTNISEDATTPSVTLPPPLPQQIQVQPQTQPQTFYSTISRETITDTFVSPPPSFEPQTGDQPKPELEEFYTTNIRDDATTPSVTPPPPYLQQTEVQSQTELQYPTTIVQEDIPAPPVTSPPPLQQQTYVEPPPQLQSFPSSNMEEVGIDSTVSSTPPDQQQIVFQPQPQLQPFSSTKITELTTDSLVPIPPFEPKIAVQTQPKLDSTNTMEVVTASPLTSPSPFEQPIDVQSRTLPQSISSITTEEAVTDSLVNQPPPVQPPTEDQTQPQLEDFNSANITEDKAMPFVTATPSFQQQVQIQPQPQLQAFSSTNIQEVIATTPVTPMSPYPQQITLQPQTELQYPTTIMREEITDSPVTTSPPPVFQQQIDVQPQSQLQSFPLTITRETVTDSIVSQPSVGNQPQDLNSTNIGEVISVPLVTPPPVFQQQIDVQPQPQPQSFSSTISRETVIDSLVSQPPSIESQSEPQLPAVSSPNAGFITTDSPVSQSPPVQEQLEYQPQPQPFSSRNSEKIMSDSLVSSPPPFPQKEVQPQPELESFSSTNSSANLQQDVETQRQSDQQNFFLRSTTEAESDSQVSASASLQGAKGEVQKQVTGNNTEVSPDSPVSNAEAKLEKHAAQEYQTQRVRYTTTSTKEVITESFLPTTESAFAEIGKDGQLKSIEIRSGSEGNSSQGKKTTEVVEEILATDFPPVTNFSSLEDEFVLADKLLNDSTPVLNTTSFITVSPLGESTVKKVVTTAVEIQKPVDQISVNTTSENAVPLGKKSTRVDHDQALPTQAPRESDQVAASNPNNRTTSPRADGQSAFKSYLRPTYGTRYSKPINKSATVSPLRSYETAFPNLQNSERRVLFKPATAPARQDLPHLNPLFQTLETHLTFPLQEPPGLPGLPPLRFWPRRAYPLPRRSQSYFPSRPSFPNNTGKPEAYLVKFQNSEKAAQETKSDPPVPVSNATDPSNGPGEDYVLPALQSRPNPPVVPS